MKSLQEAYDQLVSNTLACFVQMPDGQLEDLSTARDAFLLGEDLHVFPGSYFPLHDGHKEIFKSIPGLNKAFEISLHRIGKPTLTLAEMEDRLRQFAWYAPVIVTNLPKFIQKAGALRAYSLVFHVGYDTAERIAQQHDVAEIQGMRCNFCVYPRKVGEKVWSLSDLCCSPANFVAGPELPESVHGISSTAIRNGTKG